MKLLLWNYYGYSDNNNACAVYRVKFYFMPTLNTKTPLILACVVWTQSCILWIYTCLFACCKVHHFHFQLKISIGLFKHDCPIYGKASDCGTMLHDYVLWYSKVLQGVTIEVPWYNKKRKLYSFVINGIYRISVF